MMSTSRHPTWIASSSSSVNEEEGEGGLGSGITLHAEVVVYMCSSFILVGIGEYQRSSHRSRRRPCISNVV